MSKWPLLVVLALTAGCQYGAPPKAAPSVVMNPVITGEIDVMDMPTAGHFQSNVVITPTGCRLRGEEADINAGTTVTLYSADGQAMASARLGAGHTGIDTWTCDFHWSFGQVQGKSSSYVVEIGHRGRSGVTDEVLIANRYHFKLALGGM